MRASVVGGDAGERVGGDGAQAAVGVPPPEWMGGGTTVDTVAADSADASASTRAARSMAQRRRKSGSASRATARCVSCNPASRRPVMGAQLKNLLSQGLGMRKCSFSVGHRSLH